VLVLVPELADVVTVTVTAGGPSPSSSSGSRTAAAGLRVGGSGRDGRDDLSDWFGDGGEVVVEEVVGLAGLGELVDVRVWGVGGLGGWMLVLVGNGSWVVWEHLMWLWRSWVRARSPF
jgi:hypothetical protein